MSARPARDPHPPTPDVAAAARRATDEILAGIAALKVCGAMNERERREAIKARAERAAMGPWRWESAYECPPDAWVGPEPVKGRLLSSPGRFVVGHASYWQVRDVDAEFIAHAREDVPWLVSVLERAEAENERLRGVLEEIEAVVILRRGEVAQRVRAKLRKAALSGERR